MTDLLLQETDLFSDCISVVIIPLLNLIIVFAGIKLDKNRNVLLISLLIHGSQTQKSGRLLGPTDLF